MDRLSCLFVGVHLEVRVGLVATLLVGLSTVLGRVPAIETSHGTGTRLGCRNSREDPEYSGETVSETVRIVCAYFSWRFSFCSLGHIPLDRRIMQVAMGEDEGREESEVKNSINAWRQSERKVMIETVQDLIQTSHKYAKSQYTPNAQRVRWTKLAGQLIWYKD